jgi:preprotein translocase subunit Sss1
MERCERHEEIIDTIDDHEDRLKILEYDYAEIKTELRNLIDCVKDLVGEMRKDKEFKSKLLISGMGTTIVILVGFVIWFMQNGV